MNIQSWPRGIGYVRAQTDARDLLEELNNSVSDFKEKRKAELKAIRDEIDAINERQAASRLGSGVSSTNGNIATPAKSDFLRFMRAGLVGDSMMPQAELTTDSGSDGGFAVPKEIDGRIHDQLLEASPLRGLASVVKTKSSDYHKIVGLRGATSGWVGERETRTETSTPVLGDVSPPQGEIYAYAESTQWMMDDSQFSLETWLRENITDELEQKESNAFFLGDGVNKPRGFLTVDADTANDDARDFGTLQTVASGNASNLTPDGLISLAYSVRSPYLAGRGVGWLMNRTTAATVMKFKDQNDQYLWQNALSAGQPPMLLGYPVYEAVDMPDIGANATPVAFGNWRFGYLIVDRIGIRVVRDPYTKPGWIRFYIYKRVGGSVMDSNAVKLQKVST